MVSARAIAKNEHQSVVFIAGPTASGKTELAMQLVQRLSPHQGVDLINVDAAQVYRGMDIGTAKLTASEQRDFPHQLIDIREPWQTYDVGQFRQDALQAIEISHAAGRLPVLIGGTFFYFSALEKGVSALPKGDAELREKIAKNADQIGWQDLHQQLAEIDPEWAKKIKNTDRQRISRAWEIYQITSEAPSVVMRREAPVPLPYPVHKFALVTPDRAVLHQRIAARFEQMLEQGLLQEVQALLDKDDVSAELPAMRCVGYRQSIEHLRGDYSLDELRERGIAATRQLAKRQLTWLRHQSGWVWLPAGHEKSAGWLEGFLP